MCSGRMKPQIPQGKPLTLCRTQFTSFVLDKLKLQLSYWVLDYRLERNEKKMSKMKFLIEPELRTELSINLACPAKIKEEGKPKDNEIECGG